MKSKKYSEALLNLFKKKGFKVKEFENIIESKIIIERSGEIFKKSLLSFEDENGKNFSLRPDLTISACLDYIKNIKKEFINMHTLIKYTGELLAKNR
jgi:ATP phosphoribosyltransferase regulatory subunit HisZ